MRVGLDAMFLNLPMTGIGNYSYYLVRALIDHDPSLRFVGFENCRWRPLTRERLDEIGAAQGKTAAGTGGVRRSRGWRRQAMQWAALRLYRIELLRAGYRQLRRVQFGRTVRNERFDLFHALSYRPPADPGVPTLPVIYDLSSVRHPQFHPEERVRWLSQLPDTIARAPMVQTISEFSRSEITAVFGYPRDRIVVAPPAAAPVFRPLGLEATQAAVEEFELHAGQYLLGVGTLEPRKNFSTLIAAYSKVPSSTRMRYPLVIAGGRGWGDLKLPADASGLLREGTLRFAGSVSDSQLRSLYEGARAVFFPSLYEGFGMPVLEALACGTPVVHSANTAMTEVSNGLAIEVPAMDVAAWTEAISASLEPDPSGDSTPKISRVARARSFSWRRSAETVACAYATIVHA